MQARQSTHSKLPWVLHLAVELKWFAGGRNTKDPGGTRQAEQEVQKEGGTGDV